MSVLWEGLQLDVNWAELVPPAHSCTLVFFHAVADEFSSFARFASSLLTLETLLVVAVAAGMPCFFYYYQGPDGQQFYYSESWTLISVFLVFPLTMAMTSAFQRREVALSQLSVLKSNLMCIYLAHKHWDWWTIPKDPLQPAVSGRAARLPPGHVQEVYLEISSLIRLIKSDLSAPITSRLRNYYTRSGRKERQVVRERTRRVHEQISLRLQQLSHSCEEFKAAGLPGNEATRIRQHFQSAISALMQLRFIKHYRTPNGLRAFARLFILVLPVLYGPYYASLANSTNIGFSVAFSVSMSLALQGLFNLRTELEDPFLPADDAVDLDLELGGLQADLDIFHEAEKNEPSCEVAVK